MLNIRLAFVGLYSAALGFAIHTDYLLISVCLGQPSVERLRKLLHPVGQCRIIDTVLHAAESHLGWDTVLQHRSYKKNAGSVGIAIYDNRVKIENPGTFPSNWDTEK